MNIPFFRPSSQLDEASVLPDVLLDETFEPMTRWQDTIVSNLASQAKETMTNASYVRIGIVSVADNNSQLPALLTDANQSQSIQRFYLPRNPRIANNELYELDGMDYIVMLSGQDKRISKDMMRWLPRLKHLGIPMLVLLPYEIKKRREQQQVDLFSQQVGMPVIAISGKNVEQERHKFLTKTLELMPAMSLALAAHLPSFRAPLIHNLLDNASSDGLVVDNPQDLQMQLVRQICVAYGFTEREFEKQKIALETLVKSTNHFTKKMVGKFPIQNDSRRLRFNNALSILLIGHAVSMYMGAEAPTFRKTLLPQVWRLYRASRSSISS